MYVHKIMYVGVCILVSTGCMMILWDKLLKRATACRKGGVMSSFKAFDFQRCVSESWRRSSISELKMGKFCCDTTTEQEKADEISKEYWKYISIVREYGEEFTKVIHESFVMLFLAACGTVIDIMYFHDMHNEKKFEIGMSFKEDKIGTNAVALSMALDRPVKMMPEEHYGNILYESYEYCIPLYTDGNTVGYLDFITRDKYSFDRMVDVAHVFKFCTYLTSPNSFKVSSLNSFNTELLSSRQTQVLVNMAKGMTEYAISKELGVSEDTVRFHKRNIFDKLNVNCTVQAVVKAIKYKYISLSDI